MKTRTTKFLSRVLPIALIVAVGYGLRASNLQAPASGTWAPAPGAMLGARYGAAAAALQDGRVLVTGGEAGGTVLASVEIFNADGSFAPAAPMTFARRGHTAVTLADGRVLVAGGVTLDGGATNSAELYDPISDSWSPAGAMIEPRSGHTATLLADGRVLIAGGEFAGAASFSLEMFDPVSNTFAPAGTLLAARTRHAAAALPEGRVLLTGGSDGTNPQASTEFYDVETGIVSPGPFMSSPRVGHSATALLNGDVLVAGGSNGAEDLGTGEVYSAASGLFTLTSNALTTPRSGHLAVRLPHNNSVLLAGGTSGSAAVSTAELFLPWTESFVSTGSMGEARAAASAAAGEGVLLVAGGCSAGVPAGGAGCDAPLASAELYGFATIKTDKDDYAPGETVTITGSGWEAQDSVMLTLTEVNNPEPHPPRVWIVTADANGNLFDNSFYPEEHDLGIRFTLTAVGERSQAQATFTDSVTSVTITSPTTASPVTFTSLPANLTVSFNYVTSTTGATTAVADLLGTAVTGTKSITPGTGSDSITLTVPSGTANGNYNVKVTVTNSTGTGANNKNDNQNNAVIINVATDTTPPVITPNVSGTLGNNGWYVGDVAVSFTVSDPESSITSQSATCTTTTNITTDTAGQTVTCTATSAGGTSSSSVTIKRDATDPVITFVSRTPAANSHGWNNTDVDVNWSCSDAMSGVLHASITNTVTSEGENQSSTGTCEDQAGNTASDTQTGINIDKTPPTASASASPPPNANGWNNTDVTVTFSGTDSLSGIDSCTAPITLSTEGAGQSASGTCTDKAGNVSETATASEINIDKTAPTASASASPAANAQGWNNTDVTVTFSGSDDMSGIASCDLPVVLSSEGSGQSASGTCTDNAGNVSAPATASGINIDKTKPLITGNRSPLPNAKGWNNTDVTVSFTCADGLSGILSDTVAGATLTGEGAGQSVTNTGTCEDNAGNVADPVTVSGINIDKTAPTITGSRAPAANAYGWNNTDVTVTFACADALSGIDTCGPTPQVVTTEGAGQSRTGTAVDLAGNVASDTVSDINIDKTPPVVTVTGVSDGAIYTLGAVPTAGCSTTDSLSGVLTNAAVNVTGGVPPGVGSFTATCSGGTDRADNVAAPVSVTYQVQYAPAGGICYGNYGHVILQPIDFTGASVFPKKQGSTVPAKFRVCDVSGNSIGAPYTVVTDFKMIGAMTGTTAGEPNSDVPSTTPDSAFRWSSSDQQWIFNISTKSLLAGYTYYFKIWLNDGSTIDFQFGLR